MSIQDQFEDFLKDIEPSLTTKERQDSAHENLRKFLTEHEEFGSRVLSVDRAGSSSKGTQIRPQVIEGEEERSDIDVTVVTNFTLQDDPKYVLDTLYKVLKEKYPNLRKQARSIGVFTASIDMDVVPLILPDPLLGQLYIPDRKLEKWLKTNPPGHIKWVSEIDELADGLFRPLIKLGKWWRRENPTISAKPKGFMLECILSAGIDVTISDYAKLFVSTLERLVTKYSAYAASVPVPFFEDPAVPGNNVFSNMTPAAFAGFIAKAEKTAELGREALEATDELLQIQIWREIFGHRFPASKEKTVEARTLKELMFSQSVSVDKGTGQITMKKNAANVQPYRPQRFHSDRK